MDIIFKEYMAENYYHFENYYQSKNNKRYQIKKLLYQAIGRCRIKTPRRAMDRGCAFQLLKMEMDALAA